MKKIVVIQLRKNGFIDIQGDCDYDDLIRHFNYLGFKETWKGEVTIELIKEE